MDTSICFYVVIIKISKDLSTGYVGSVSGSGDVSFARNARARKCPIRRDAEIEQVALGLQALEAQEIRTSIRNES